MEPQKPRVSVGLPVFNAEKYLEQAIDSILKQTFSNFELIISDNASTDRTQEICMAYAAKDPRIRYSRNEINLGAAPNFSQVFKLSESEYFKWAPYDDLVAPDFLSRCVEILDQNPKVVLCYSKVKIIDEKSVFVVDYNPGPDTGSRKPHERFRNLVLKPEYAVQQMGLIRSEILKKTELMGSYPSSDEVFLAQVALLGEFYEIPERLYLYRRHSEQSTQGELKVQRTRVLFFDTSLKGKIILPKWLYFFACLRVIRHSPLRADERLYCYFHMLRWVFIPSNFRALGKDVLLAANQVMKRILHKSQLKIQHAR
jgi:glycosyltransferase involved in cell wall biosynthesis